MTPPWEDERVLDGMRRQLDRRAAAIDRGERPIGWKVGFGAPAALELMQISAPLLGYLTDATVIETGSTTSVAGWVSPLIEFELAVRVGVDVDGHTASTDAAAAVDALAPAIEIADLDLPVGPEHVSEILAGDIFHRGVVLGAWDEARAGLDIADMRGHIRVDDTEIAAVDDLQAITGLYPEIVSTVAMTLSVVGERLRAGDVIITGSIIPPVPIESAQFFEFELSPLPPITMGIHAPLDPDTAQSAAS